MATIFGRMISETQEQFPFSRRVELDWLRVASVSLVFLHHVGMPFNGDHWHIMNAQSSKALDDIMVYFEQWRLPLLLIISGAGTLMAFSRHAAWGFIKQRIRRLFIPLVVGVLLIVPPQTFFQYKDRFTSYADLYQHFPDYIEYNHLWFIKYLFYFSMIIVPLVVYLRSVRSRKMREGIGRIFDGRWAILFLFIPVVVIKIGGLVFFPDAKEQWINLPNVAYYFYFFVTGILLFSSPEAWNNIGRCRKHHLVTAVVSIILFYGCYFLPREWFSTTAHIELVWAIWFIVSALAGWTTILAVIGYAQRYLNHPKPILKQLNEAIYPFYILHQTIIVVLAYYIVSWEVSLALKLVALLAGSFVAIVAIYRLLIYPFTPIRILFGMKAKKSVS